MPGLGRDQHPLDRGDEVGIAQILRHQLGGRPGAARADMEDIGGDRIEQRPIFGERGVAGADHHGHRRRAAADRRIDQFDPARPAGFGDAGDGLRRIGGQVDMGGTWLQPGEDAGLRFQHRRLEFGGAGKRGEHDLAVARRGEGAVGAHRALRAQGRGGLRAAVINRKRMAGADQAARDRGPHRSGADKADPHRVAALRRAAIIGRPAVDDNRASSRPASGTDAVGPDLQHTQEERPIGDLERQQDRRFPTG